MSNVSILGLFFSRLYSDKNLTIFNFRFNIYLAKESFFHLMHKIPHGRKAWNFLRLCDRCTYWTVSHKNYQFVGKKLASNKTNRNFSILKKALILNCFKESWCKISADKIYKCIFEKYFRFLLSQGSFPGQGNFGLSEVIFVYSWSISSKIYSLRSSEIITFLIYCPQ